MGCKLQLNQLFAGSEKNTSPKTDKAKAATAKTFAKLFLFIKLLFFLNLFLLFVISFMLFVV